MCPVSVPAPPCVFLPVLRHGRTQAHDCRNGSYRYKDTGGAGAHKLPVLSTGRLGEARLVHSLYSTVLGEPHCTLNVLDFIMDRGVVQKDRRCTLWCNHHAQGRPVSVSDERRCRMTLADASKRRIRQGNQGQYQILDDFPLSCMHSLPPADQRGVSRGVKYLQVPSRNPGAPFGRPRVASSWARLPLPVVLNSSSTPVAWNRRQFPTDKNGV